MAMYRLLIVDDEPEIRNGLRHYFPWEEIGFSIVGEARDGIHALEVLACEAVDVLLCDIVMPRMTGLELAKKLRENKSKVEIVLLSSYEEFEYARQAIDFSVYHYLVKPVKYAQLVEVFTRLRFAMEERGGDTKFMQQGQIKGYYEQIIETAQAYIRAHYANATLEDVAAAVHLNPYYFSSLYKQKTGENLSEFHTRIRMETAVVMLDDISLRISDIANMLGYSNPNSFSRTFRAYYAMSPREHRLRKGVT